MEAPKSPLKPPLNPDKKFEIADRRLGGTLAKAARSSELRKGGKRADSVLKRFD